jgi:hypothetical protein
MSNKMKERPILSSVGEREISTQEIGSMTYIGFDQWTQAAVIDDQGKIIREMRVFNDSGSLKGFLKGYRMRSGFLFLRILDPEKNHDIETKRACG